MCKVLMPIKPEYAMQILNGTKTFEYRKIKFKRKNVDSIVIYRIKRNIRRFPRANMETNT